ncbi:MAG: glycerophosphodiester phosphodiesterase [Acidobacteria bacterium]|nr:glycerophosphodiester phosphodiesterase [Acidobacteriota bacterium]
MPARPLLLGHRGSRKTPSVAENSFAAFDLSLQHGCDGFEFDLRLTLDGCPIISHDARGHGKVISHTRCAQLAGFPRLEEVVQRYAGRAFLDLEIKVAGMESSVLAALRHRMPARNFVVSSFLPDVVLNLKARSASVLVGIICEHPRQLVHWRKLPVDYVIVHRSLVTRKLVQAVQDDGRRVLVWTVNDKATMLRLAGWGVDGIISDNTRLLGETLGKNSGKD